MVPRGPFSLIAAFVCVAAACGGSSHSAQPTAQVIVAATSGADTARFHTVMNFGDVKKDGFRYETTGAVDFANRRGDVTASGQQKGVTSPIAEARWIGDDIYVKGAGALVGGAPGGWALVNAAKFHAASSCLAKEDVVSMLSGSGIESPSGVLDTLKNKARDLERIGPETIRGVSTTHWRVAPTDWPVRPSCSGPTSTRHTTVRVGLDIWTDTHDRALRFRLAQVQTSTLDGHTDTQKSDTTTDFSEFGASVAVQRPPSARVSDKTDALIAVTLGPGTVKESDWQDVAHGVIGTKPWKIFAARTSTGWRCFDTSDSPQDPMIGLTNGFATHDGHSTNCLVAGGLDSFFGPVSIFVNDVSGSQHTLVGASPNDGAVRMEFKDGSSEPVAVDAHTWMFVWSGPKSEVPIRLRIGGVSCRLDGHGVVGPAADVGKNQEVACNGIATYG